VRVIFWEVPEEISLSQSAGNFEPYEILEQASAVRQYTLAFDLLINLCLRCPTCTRLKRPATLQEGALLNAWSLLCLDHTFAKGPTMFACHFLVVRAPLGCPMIHLFQSGNQHVALASSQQLIVRNGCLGANSSRWWAFKF
jgi:hypothetical protein